jgi:hypothetical protein
MADAPNYRRGDAFRTAAYPLTGAATDYDSLLDLTAGARFVLLGERVAWHPRVLLRASRDYEATYYRARLHCRRYRSRLA